MSEARVPLWCGPAVAAGLLLGGCAAVEVQPRQVFAEPQPGAGLVYFYREDRFVGSAVSYHIDEDGRRIGALVSGSYFFHHATPGEHTYSAETEVKENKTLRVDAGRTYYIRGDVEMGLLAGRPRLTVVAEAEGRAALGGLKYATLPGGVAAVAAPAQSTASAPPVVIAGPAATEVGGERVTVAILPPASRADRESVSAQGDIERITHRFVRENESMLLAYSAYGDGGNFKRKLHAEQYWNPGVSTREPDDEAIYRIGDEMGVDLILIHFMARTMSGWYDDDIYAVQLYLYDVRARKRTHREADQNTLHAVTHALLDGVDVAALLARRGVDASTTDQPAGEAVADGQVTTAVCGLLATLTEEEAKLRDQGVAMRNTIAEMGRRIDRLDASESARVALRRLLGPTTVWVYGLRELEPTTTAAFISSACYAESYDRRKTSTETKFPLLKRAALRCQVEEQGFEDRFQCVFDSFRREVLTDWL